FTRRFQLVDGGQLFLQWGRARRFDLRLVHATRVKRANLLFVAALGSVGILCRILENLVQRRDVLLAQRAGYAPGRKSRRYFILRDPAAIGILIKIVAGFATGGAHVGGIEAVRRGLREGGKRETCGRQQRNQRT